MIRLHFELRQHTRADIYQHLVLFGLHAPPGSAPHAHWVFPSELSGFLSLEHALLLTEASNTDLPDRMLDAGRAHLSTAAFPIQRSYSQLTLILHGQHLTGQFDLQRLQPGGTMWLLKPVAAVRPFRNPHGRLPAGRTVLTRQ